jgi:hypothetical protein
MNEDIGVKHDNEKPRWELVPPFEMEEIVKSLSFGSKKYSDDNWKSVRPVSRYIGAMHRHINAWQQGEIRDPESGLHHLAHASACALFLMWFDNQEVENE